MTIRPAISALLAALLVLLSVLPTQGAEHAWLVGRWELTHAPDGDPKDWVGRAVYIFQGREVPVLSTIDPGRTKLLLYSAKTRDTSTYDKVR